MNEMHGWYAVRCCCAPKKIFGFLYLPLMVNEGLHRATDVNGMTVELKIRGFTDYRVAGPCALEDFLTTKPPKTELAVYSDDQPVEFWRNMPGFIEVRP